MKSSFTILAAAAVLAAVSLASCQKVSLGDIEDRLGKVEQTVDSISGIKTGVQTISYELTALAADVDALKERISSQGAGGDDSRVQALGEAVRDLQAWASFLDGIGDTLEGINTDLASQSATLSSLDASLRGTDAAVSALQTQVDAVQPALEAASQDPGSGAAVAGLIARVNALEPKVSTLESTVATLQAALSALTGRVENVELELADIDGQIAGIGTTIDGLRTVVDALQASSASSSAQAQTAIAALEARIAALEQLQGSLATKDWAEATFATLDAQAQTAATLAGVQAAVAAALAGMPEGKTVTDAIAEAIAAASQSVKSWVNEQLAGYYTIGTIDGKLSAMKAELEAKVAALDNKADSLDTALTAEIEAAEASIATLETALEAAKAEITTAYTAAITTAKTELEGKITANTTAINAANTKIGTLEGKVTTLETNITSLTNRMTAVEGDVEKLKSMVQSVVFVPRYKGGSAVVKSPSELESFTLEYEILPVEAAKEIPTAWASGNDILVLNSRTVLTRSGLASIPITGVTYNSGSKLLEVSVSFAGEAETLLSSDSALAVSLTVNTGGAMVSSPFTDIDNSIKHKDLSAGGTANCYIVNDAGEYRFDAKVRGNGKKTDGTDAAPITGVASAKVLWESFGTDNAVNRGDLVSDPIYAGGNVFFEAPKTFKEGNAVIAVVDGADKILWSWHIWLTDKPFDEEYTSAGDKMMDRNLGAIEATSSDKLASYGLLYQWGRKDPFLGGNGISSTTQAASTLSWPAAVSADGSNKVSYSIENPTTFIKSSLTYNYDWTVRDDNLWKSSKTMYDPCPAGYRVPDGGDTGVWKKAGFATTSWGGGYPFSIPSSTTWYPAAGWRNTDGILSDVGIKGSYWTCTFLGDGARIMLFDSGAVNPVYSGHRAEGRSVRCLRE